MLVRMLRSVPSLGNRVDRLLLLQCASMIYNSAFPVDLDIHLCWSHPSGLVQLEWQGMDALALKIGAHLGALVEHLKAFEVVQTEVFDGPLGEHLASIVRVRFRLRVALTVFLGPLILLILVLTATLG